MKQLDEFSELETNAYLIFQIEEDLFAAEVEKVVRISELPPITHIPKSPPYLKGVINQRGVVIPLIDTQYKFMGSRNTQFEYPVIILFKIKYNGEEVEIAAPVTAVKDVIPAEEIQLSVPPEIGLKYKPEYIKGLLSNKNSLILLLDVDKVFETDEIISIIESLQA